LNIVNSIEDKSSSFSEDVDAFFYLFSHFVRFAEGEHSLSVNAAAPEDQTVAIFLFEKLGVHSCSRALNRIEDVHSGVDEVI